MAPIEGSMDTLSQAVMSEAQAEADKVLAEARARADAILQEAQLQAEAERKQILERASLEADRTRRQAIATAQIKARTIQLEQREKMLDRVFDTARQGLSNLQQWSDYDRIARQLLEEAIKRLGADKIFILADQATLQCLTSEVLGEVSKKMNVQLQVKEPIKQGIGVIVEAEDGRRRYDNTLETRLSRMQDSLRAPVYHILMGETL
jgi:V/A-type H+-transporting ATPase subunit E